MSVSPRTIQQQIDALISSVIKRGICDDANYTSVRDVRGVSVVTYDGQTNNPTVRKRSEYVRLYDDLVNQRSYTMKLIDGALVQMTYQIRQDELVYHRLAFYPSASLHPFSSQPEDYMADERFLDIISRRIVPFPLRFDFDARDNAHEEGRHPKSHLTLGDVQGCRIPVTAPVTPRWFVEFMLRNFYETDDYRFVSSLPAHSIQLENTITQLERGLMHVVVPYTA